MKHTCREGPHCAACYKESQKKAIGNSALSGGLYGKIPLLNGEPEITRRMKRECHGEFMFDIEEICTACYGAETPQEDCEVCNGEITYNKKVAVPWDVVKDIYKRMAAVTWTAI